MIESSMSLCQEIVIQFIVIYCFWSTKLFLLFPLIDVGSRHFVKRML